MVHTREAASKTIFARQKSRDKQNGRKGHYFLTVDIKAAGIGRGIINVARKWYVIVTDWNIWSYISKRQWLVQ